MRTNIEIDDELMRKALVASGAPTKRAAVEEALRLMVQLKEQGKALQELWGSATWVGPDDDWFAPDPLEQNVDAAAAVRKKSELSPGDEAANPVAENVMAHAHR
jgi:Arc/MetJ family transcription regulator